ncbi:MAG: hypothetical protein ACRD4R_04250 [Candidatus Acidiferrales bacterium]
MMLADFSQIWRRVDLTVEIALAVAGILGAIRSDPKDRVLLLEFLAIGSFFLGAVLLRVWGISWQGAVIWLLLFFGFAFSAAYFGCANWLRRKRKVG